MNPKIICGTYRMTDRNPEHVKALVDAIDAGVRVIDTASHYMDGTAESAIFEALKQCDPGITDAVEVISKFGYIQGSTLKRVMIEGDYPETVIYNEQVRHCIHPDFMRAELDATLSRLGRASLACYLVNNPEYLLLDALKRNSSRTDAIAVIHERLQTVFTALEQEVSSGRIGSYGIASNSIAKSSDTPDFFPYDMLLELAENAASAAGNLHHHFTTLQLPINLMEQEGLSCASWGKSKGLRIIANRPLNAEREGLMYRLADYEISAEYYHLLNGLLETCDSNDTRSLFNLIETMDATRHRFGWIGEYELFAYKEILPHFAKVLRTLDVQRRDFLSEQLEIFLEAYAKMVAYECTLQTRSVLKEQFLTCKRPMQHEALDFLLEQKNIDYIAVGMRKRRYVADVMNLA